VRERKENTRWDGGSCLGGRGLEFKAGGTRARTPSRFIVLKDLVRGERLGVG